MHEEPLALRLRNAQFEVKRYVALAAPSFALNLRSRLLRYLFLVKNASASERDERTYCDVDC